MHEHDTKKGEVFEQSPNRRFVAPGETCHEDGRDYEPGEVQVNRDPGELEETNSTGSHLASSTKMRPAATCLQIHVGLRIFRRDQQTHRNHGRFEKAVPLEEGLRLNFGAVRQQSKAEKVFLAGKINGVFE